MYNRHVDDAPPRQVYSRILVSAPGRNCSRRCRRRHISKSVACRLIVKRHKFIFVLSPTQFQDVMPIRVRSGCLSLCVLSVDSLVFKFTASFRRLWICRVPCRFLLLVIYHWTEISFTDCGQHDVLQIVVKCLCISLIHNTCRLRLD